MVLGICHVIDVRVDGNDFKISKKLDGFTLAFEPEDQRIYPFISGEPERK